MSANVSRSGGRQQAAIGGRADVAVQVMIGVDGRAGDVCKLCAALNGVPRVLQLLRAAKGHERRSRRTESGLLHLDERTF
jgi:hypothetical protein